MIRWMRIVIVVIFIIVAGLFAYTTVTDRIASDTQAPVITAESDELEVSVTATDEDLLEGLTATDDKDGDVTDSMVVVSKSKFIRPGVVNVTYAAFDDHNNVGTYTRRVTYTDYSGPEFSMSVPLVYSVNERDVDYLEDIQAFDLLDGDLTSVIRMSVGMQSTDEAGTVIMPLTLQVVNSSGDVSEVEVDVIYQDQITYQQDAPALSDYIVYTIVGKRVDAESYLTGVRNGSNVRLFAGTEYEASDVLVDDSDVDYQTPGVYKIHYTLQPSGFSTTSTLGSTDLYVVVREN